MTSLSSVVASKMNVSVKAKDGLLNAWPLGKKHFCKNDFGHVDNAVLWVQ